VHRRERLVAAVPIAKVADRPYDEDTGDGDGLYGNDSENEAHVFDGEDCGLAGLSGLELIPVEGRGVAGGSKFIFGNMFIKVGWGRLPFTTW
jgi:hypothetical protein